MNTKPSRAEIESALSSKQNSNTDKVLHDYSLTVESRKQRVLGGNITGVDRRSKNPVNYLIFAGIALVLLILLAFFWPNKTPSVNEIKKHEQLVDKQPFYDASRIDENKPSIPSNDEQEVTNGSFTIDSDIARADAYRDEEKKNQQITLLLNQASDAIKNGRYTLPEDKNALAYYHQILKLDPNNSKAKLGLNYIQERFLESGLANLTKNKVTSAKTNLSKLQDIDDQSDEYEQLAKAIKDWQLNNQISDLLKNAKTALDKGQLILPAKDNALYFYREVLKLNELDEQATKGIDNIASKFIEQANQSILKGEYEAARGYLTTASVINPQLESIKLLTKVANDAQGSVIQAEKNRGATQTDQKLDLQNNVISEKITTQKVNNQTALPQQNTARTIADISQEKTTEQQTTEQQLLDQQYLQRGLNAYYQGNYVVAKNLLKPLADKGISRAQLRIGYMYYLGRGYTKNTQRADQIVRAALPAIQKFAKQERAWAQSDLGSLYEDGLVLPKSYSDAVYWYRRSAEQGYAGAQTNLGIMYARGLGVKQDRSKAIKWFKLAAKQGDVAAQRNLKSMNAK